MIHDDGAVITNNFDQKLETIIGKIEIADTPHAKKMWELFRKNPQLYELAVGYIVKEEKDGVVTKAELVEVSLVTKGES